MEIGYETGLQGCRKELPHLVFLHGAGGRGAGWLGLLSPLGKNWNTIALDLPGHGDTPGPALATVAEQVEWLNNALQELEIERFILVGHSMGGALALSFALAHPGRAQGLALIGTGGHLPVNPKLLQGLETQFVGTAAMIIDWCFAHDDQDLKNTSLDLMLAAGQKSLVADFTACADFDIRDKLAGLELPCLVLSGSKDKLTPQSMAEELAKALPRAQLEIIDGAGHMVYLEEMSRTKQALAAFAGQVWE